MNPNNQTPQDEQRTSYDQTSERSTYKRKTSGRKDERTYERTLFDDQMDILIDLLGDSTPIRGIYYNIINRIGFQPAHDKALALRTDPKVRNCAAVFSYWSKRQPYTAQLDTPTPPPMSYKDPRSGDTVLIDIDDKADPTAGLDEAIARLR